MSRACRHIAHPRPRRSGAAAKRRSRPRSILRIVVVTPRAPHGTAIINGSAFPCALGRSGLSQRKREGDGATPIGRWPLRGVLFRPDRGPRPPAALPVAAIAPQDGWCDDPASRSYNRAVRLPCRFRHERMWRDDRLYDLVMIIGHNDAPAVAGHGSAIFIHCAGPSLAPTEGCIALAPRHLGRILPQLAPPAEIVIGAARARALR